MTTTTANLVNPVNWKPANGIKPIDEQIDLLGKMFGLETAPSLKYARKASRTFTPPLRPVSLMAVLSSTAFSKLHHKMPCVHNVYCRTIEQLHKKIEAREARFVDHAPDQLKPHCFIYEKQWAEQGFKLLEQRQPTCILVVPAHVGQVYKADQTGLRTRDTYHVTEYGMDALMISSIILTHSEKIFGSKMDDIAIPALGNEHSPKNDGQFTHTPVYRWFRGKLHFGFVKSSEIQGERFVAASWYLMAKT
ncbi:MAG: hypothetical protein PHF79_03660 [Candidatus Pacebacteria bacterium]|nr:hypothetical protein [Candidatus Paceibacterota bacterium]